MSVIAGLWCRDGQPDAAEGCARMLAAQEIYAHDGRAQWADGPVALGRGLSKLLPEDAFDRQPLIGGGGKFVLVADLRLDNRDELTAALNISAERARTLCDAAVLLAAFERWDNDCYDHLVGDYAFALWDASGRRLVLARSPMGQRPLHYHWGKGFFAFASMPKGLHALPKIPYAPDEERFAEFIAMLPDAGTRSYFAGIERVPPAHFALVTGLGISLHRHWQPQRRTVLLRSADEYVEAMRHHLDQAVRCRLRGTDDVGATLSAGLDSSAVATTAARLLQPSGRKVIAFTAVPREGYDGPTPARRIGDEGPLAAMTAAMHPNIEHMLVRSDRHTPFDDLDRSFFFRRSTIVPVDVMGYGLFHQRRRLRSPRQGHAHRRTRQCRVQLRRTCAVAGTPPQRTLAPPVAGNVGSGRDRANEQAWRDRAHSRSMGARLAVEKPQPLRQGACGRYIDLHRAQSGPPRRAWYRCAGAGAQT